MNFISLDIARKIADAALAEAQRRQIANASVVVTDMGGDIRVALRADASGAFGVETARGKAQAALGFNRSSLQLEKIFGPAPYKVSAINAATRGRFVPIGGAVLVVDQAGMVIGAASMSGGMPEVDDEIITFAVRSTGLDVPK